LKCRNSVDQKLILVTGFYDLSVFEQALYRIDLEIRPYADVEELGLQFELSASSLACVANNLFSLSGETLGKGLLLRSELRDALALCLCKSELATLFIRDFPNCFSPVLMFKLGAIAFRCRFTLLAMQLCFQVADNALVLLNPQVFCAQLLAER
jgi:hypothetical protein